MSDGWQLALDWLLSQITTLQIEALQAVTTLFWWLHKLAANVAGFLIDEDMWSLLLDIFLRNLSDVMPTIFQQLIFSSTGIFYIALSLAGLLLIVGMTDNKIAEARQVLLWGVFVAALFVSTAPTVNGYDLISTIERLRRWSSNTIITTVSPNGGDARDLVRIPMRATSAETALLDFTLPTQFQTNFYPPATNFTTQTGLFVDTWVTGQITIDFEIEDASAQQARQRQAITGLLIATLTFAPAALLVMFGVIFATMAAAALVLILFLLTTIPLGFFEFGKVILRGLLMQYTVLWVISLASSTLIGLVIRSGAMLLAGSPNLNDLVLYLPFLAVVGIAIAFIAQAATKTLLGTFGMLTATVRATLAESTVNARLPEGGRVPLSQTSQRGMNAARSLAGLAVVGATAALTGGTSALVPALAGAGLARTNPSAARDAALLARISSKSKAARNFAAGAITDRALPSSVAVYMVNRDGDNRRATSVPRSNRELAQATLRGDGASTTQPTQQQAAAVSLQRTAQEHLIDTDDLAAIFNTVRTGLANALREGREAGLQPSLHTVSQAVIAHPLLEQLPEEQQTQVAQDSLRLMQGEISQTLLQQVAEPEQAADEVERDLLERLNLNLRNVEMSERASLMQHAWQGLEAEAETGGEVSAESHLTTQLRDHPHFGKLEVGERAALARDAVTLIRGSQIVPPQPPSDTRLAHTVLHPATASPQTDIAAVYRLNRYASRHHLDESHLAALFQAVRAGVERAARTGVSPSQAAYNATSRMQQFSGLPADERLDISRQALFVVQSDEPIEDTTP